MLLPDDAIKNTTKENWEEIFDEYLVFQEDYVWKPEIMKEFIRKIVGE